MVVGPGIVVDTTSYSGDTKYVIMRNDKTGEETPFIFPNHFTHADLPRPYGYRRVAAGFVFILEDGNVKVKGRSESLNLDNRGEIDEKLIKHAFAGKKMQRLTDMSKWTVGIKKSGAIKMLLESSDNMVYATNADRSIIYGNWALDARFGWLYAIPMRWETRYRKFKEL